MKAIMIASALFALSTAASAEGVVAPVSGADKLKVAIDCMTAAEGPGSALHAVGKPTSAVAYFKLKAGGFIQTNSHHVDFTVGTLDNEGFAERVKACDEAARNAGTNSDSDEPRGQQEQQ